MSRTLVLNLGLKSMRAAVFDMAGRREGIAYRPISTQIAEGSVEQDPDEWWRAAEAVTRELIAEVGADGVSIVTVTASAGCLVTLDARSAPIGKAIMISDVRARPQAEAIERQMLFGDVARQGRRVTPDLMLPKILWVRESDPDRFHATRWFATPNDFLVARLTGEVVTDPYNAGKYFYEASGPGYPERLLRALDIDVARLPPVVASPSTRFPLLPTVRERLGLPSDCSAVLSTYDAIAAVYGAGVARPGEACDVSGTVTSFRAVTALPVRDPEGRVFVSPDVRPGLFLAGGSNNLGGGVIEWAKQLLYVDEPDPYRAMERDAADAPPGAAGITFLPYLLGERAPIWDASARGVFFGLGRNHARSDLLRAVFEGVGYSVLDIRERLSDLGVTVTSVMASGGLARLSAILQIKADMLGVPVRVTEEIESTALGAALVARLNIGDYGSLEEATGLVRLGREFRPVRERTAMYRDFFSIYRSLYTSLRDQFADRSRLLALHAEVLRAKPAETENL